MMRFPQIHDPISFLEHLETLFRQAEAHPDPRVWDLVLGTSEAVMHLHHEALRRIVAILRRFPELFEHLREDPIVGMVLEEHGLLEEPSMEDRITAALEKVRPYMHAHGGDVELLGVEDGVVRLRLVGACFGCASSAITLRAGIEQVLRQEVPELRGIEVEGVAEPKPAFIPIDRLVPARGWVEVGPAAEFPFGTRHVVLNGTAVLFCTAFGRIYAVLDRCPWGGGSLQGARLEAFLLVCPCHGERYDLRSGRSLTDPTLSLELLPVVVERGTVRVALPEKVSAGD
jgi:Fe-S cluster biogenesis protein NfuA/nitrite reductase/ring-hydroxylating ferredoxin subunit